MKNKNITKIMQKIHAKHVAGAKSFWNQKEQKSVETRYIYLKKFNSKRHKLQTAFSLLDYYIFP
jgi:hypothetical protein